MTPITTPQQLRQGRLSPFAILLAVCAVLAFSLGSARGVTNFVETFDTDNADWGDQGSFPVAWDGGGYITTTGAFATLGQGVLFRAHDEFFLPAPMGSSGGAFIGNWIADGVNQFTVDVRHNFQVPISFFARYSGPGNFPGATQALFAPPVAPNTWTTLTFSIFNGNPEFVTFEGSDFATVFGNIGHVQVGADAPAGFEMSMTDITFDLDNAGVSVVPEPASAAFLMAGGLLLGLRRRR